VEGSGFKPPSPPFGTRADGVPSSSAASAASSFPFPPTLYPFFAAAPIFGPFMPVRPPRVRGEYDSLVRGGRRSKGLGV
jgi:hypothetical protein